VFRVVPERAGDELARGVDGEAADVLGRGGSVPGVPLYRASAMCSRPPGSFRASAISSEVCADTSFSHGGLAPFHFSGHDGEAVTFEVMQLDGQALVFGQRGERFGQEHELLVPDGPLAGRRLVGGEPGLEPHRGLRLFIREVGRIRPPRP
jgi:hypothetical protein